MQANPDRPPAQERVRFLGEVEIGDRFVATDVHRARDDRPRSHCAQDGCVHREVILFGWRRASIEIEELGTQQPDPLSAVLQGDGRLFHRPDVRHDLHAAVVTRRRRISGGAAFAHRLPFGQRAAL